MKQTTTGDLVICPNCGQQYYAQQGHRCPAPFSQSYWAPFQPIYSVFPTGEIIEKLDRIIELLEKKEDK